MQESNSSGEGPTWRAVNIAQNLPQGESRDSSSDQSAAKWFTSKNENVGDSHDRRHTEESKKLSPAMTCSLLIHCR